MLEFCYSVRTGVGAYSHEIEGNDLVSRFAIPIAGCTMLYFDMRGSELAF